MNKDELSQMISEGFIDKIKNIKSFLDRLPGKYVNILTNPIKIIKKVNIKTEKDAKLYERKIKDFLIKDGFELSLTEPSNFPFFTKILTKTSELVIVHMIGFIPIDNERFTLSSTFKSTSSLEKFQTLYADSPKNVFKKIKDTIDDSLFINNHFKNNMYK